MRTVKYVEEKFNGYQFVIIDVTICFHYQIMLSRFHVWQFKWALFLTVTLRNDQKSSKFFCQDALIHHVFLEKDKFGNN